MKETIAYLKSLLKDNDTIVIGLSGGPDSMCLLDVIKSLNKNIKIVCAHINHNIRKESFEEQKYIEVFKQSQMHNMLQQSIVTSPSFLPELTHNEVW